MKDEIRNYLIPNNASGRKMDVTDDQSLLEAGVIDSVVMVDLIAFLEKTYGISVEEDDMIPENFETVDAIATYVDGKRPQA
jgi:acyl carrier protein